MRSQGSKQRAIKRHYWRSMRSSPIRLVCIQDLHLDPGRFQFKQSADSTGNSHSLTHVKQWNTLLEGVIDCWVDPLDRNIYVVNGHNRVLLAQRLSVKKLWIRLLPSKNWQTARRDGAIANIGSGCGTVLDAAKFFAQTEFSKRSVERYGMSLRDSFVKHGWNISRLQPDVLQLALTEVISVDKASILGASNLDPDLQLAIAKLLIEREKSGEISNGEFTELIEFSKSENASVQVTELTLFGEETFSELLIFEIAKINAYIKAELGKDKRAYSTAIRSKQTLESAGNTIIESSSIDALSTVERYLDVFNREKYTNPAITKIVNEHANLLRLGQSLGSFGSRLIEQIKETL